MDDLKIHYDAHLYGHKMFMISSKFLDQKVWVNQPWTRWERLKYFFMRRPKPIFRTYREIFEIVKEHSGEHLKEELDKNYFGPPVKAVTWGASYKKLKKPIHTHECFAAAAGVIGDEPITCICGARC